MIVPVGLSVIVVLTTIPRKVREREDANNGDSHQRSSIIFCSLIFAPENAHNEAWHWYARNHYHRKTKFIHVVKASSIEASKNSTNDEDATFNSRNIPINAHSKYMSFPYNSILSYQRLPSLKDFLFDVRNER